ncbi:MAG TPA: hypothetical protein VIL43_06765 [Burkholderiales bacterium]
MQCWKGIACAIGAAVVLSACAAPRAVPEAPAPDVHALGGALAVDPLSELISFAERVRKLPPARQQWEIEIAREAYSQSPDALTRLKLAVLLASAPPGLRDTARARALLRATAQDASATQSMRAVASLWLEDMAQREALEQALEEERRQRLALQQKMEQLKSIEEEMDRRAVPPVVPTR